MEEKHNLTLSEESGIGESQEAYLTPVSFAWILHSTSYFFIILFPTAFYDRSRITGRYLVPFYKKRFSFCSHYFRSYIFAHTYFLFLHVCSHLPLSTANAATFPDKRGQLSVCILLFYGNNQVIHL